MHALAKDSRTSDLLWIAVVATAFLGAALGVRDLWNPNEPTYGRVVAEMLERRDWLVPYMNGVPFVEKPILYYWLAALSAAAFGLSEAALRVPVLLAGVASTCFTYLLVRGYDGRKRAITACVLFVTTYLVWWTSRSIQMDSFVLLTTVVVVYLVVGILDHGAPLLRNWLLAGAAAGLGFLAKGPVTVVVPGLILLSYALWTRTSWRRFVSGVPLGVAAFIAIAAPWYLALFFTGHTAELNEVLLRQNFERFVAAWDHDQPWWYYLKYIWIVFAPWSWFLPVAAGVAIDRRYAKSLKPRALAWIGLLAPLIFFSLSDSKRAPYLLPAAPFVAWLAAVVVDHLRQKQLHRRERVVCLATCGLLGGILLAAALYVTTRGGQSEESLASVPLTGVSLGVGGVGLALLLAALAPWGRRRAATVLAGGVASLYLLLAVWVSQGLNGVKSARGFMQQARAVVAASTPIYSYLPTTSHLRGGYAYYNGGPIPDLRTPDKLVAVWRSERPCVIYENDLPRSLESELDPSRRVLSARVGSNEAHLICAISPTGRPAP